MAHTIITKNSSTAGAVPSAGSLTKGELAINVADRRLYSKDALGNVIEVGGSGTVLKYRDNFTGDGSTVAFTLPRTPLNEELVDIYCDGVYQGKDTFSISGAVITFDEAPLAGASIEVITFQSSPIGETAANYVSYTPAGTGAVATTVQSKLRETVSMKDFGAVGDGVTDDTASVLAALNSGAKVVDGQGLTYRITSQMSPDGQNIRIQNATLDFTDVPAGVGVDFCLTFAGTQGTPTALTTNCAAGAFQINVVSTSGFVADGYAWLYSTALFDVSTGCTLGQVVKIKTVNSATQLTLYDNVKYAFNISDSASIATLNPKANIQFDNVKFIGSGTGDQCALNFDRCLDVIVNGCKFDSVNYLGTRFFRTINGTVSACSLRYARVAGTAYGFGILGGSYGIRVTNSYGEDTRHFVTVIGSDGVSMNLAVTGNVIKSSRDAGIDAHPSADFMVIDGNVIEMAAVEDGISDGIIFQGLNCVISNNVIDGAKAHPIIVQRYSDYPNASCVIDGNSIRNGYGTGATDFGIYVSAQSGVSAAATTANVTISNNVMQGTFESHIQVYAYQGHINNVVIVGNSAFENASSFSIGVQTDGAYTVNNVTISGNIAKTSGGDCIYFIGAAANSIQRASVTGNVIIGTTRGIRLTNVQGGAVDGNYMSGISVPYFESGSSDIRIAESIENALTITNATHTVTIGNKYLIANRAGTITLTLPSATLWPGRELNVKTLQAQTVVSNASNVVPISGGAAGTAILPATAGAWSMLKSNGTDWVIMQRG